LNHDISKSTHSIKTKFEGEISGAQMDFFGGPALQNYNSRWRQPWTKIINSRWWCPPC